MKDEFIRNIHYYLDGDRVIFTEKWLIKRGECCGNGCKHCPFIPKHIKGNIEVDKVYLTKED
jgi:hypothetical protein